RTGLAETIDGADLVITGEGKIDAQSLFGKVPVGVARIARARGIPVVAFSGLIEDPGQRARIEGLTLLWPIVDRPMTVEEAMGGVAELLSRAARRLLETVHLGRLIQTE
ncbi:MAG: glycerate kinase, partial [Candidatus Competibacteraceae bacterium]|nr:glycerate kinase [Candidatus Competibacteraceae bacterium]